MGPGVFAVYFFIFYLGQKIGNLIGEPIPNELNEPGDRLIIRLALAALLPNAGCRASRGQRLR